MSGKQQVEQQVEVEVHELPTGKALAPTTPGAVINLVQLAIDSKYPVEALERLVALHERVSDRAAAQEFHAALAAFQSECPPISKNQTAKIVPNSGIAFQYTYASLDHIAGIVGPLLAKYGLAYSWDSSLDGGKLIVCVCTLRHVNGHHVTASFTCPTESRAGMSEQQKHAAALSYARRQSLVQVLGLTTCDPDTDAANPEPITKDQADDLRQLLNEKGADLKKFLAYCQVARLEDIPARDFEALITRVRAHEPRARK